MHVRDERGGTWRGRLGVRRRKGWLDRCWSWFGKECIGFVGLVVPHLARLAVGSDPRAVLPLSAIGGALLLLLADTVARTIGVPVGVITALIGAPFLLWLLHRARAGYAL